MKKIHVKKSDSAASVISKVVRASDSAITVYIPRGTKFAKSRNNFILLKREARTAQKEVNIESIDSDVLELASMSGLRATSPLGHKRRSVSDIVVVSLPEESEDNSTAGKKEKKRKFGIKKVRVEEVRDDSYEDSYKEKLSINSAYIDQEDSEMTKEFIDEDELSDEDITPFEPKKKTKRKWKREKSEKKVKTKKNKGAKKKLGKLKKILIFSSFVVIVAIAIFVIVTVLPQATINLDFEKTEWDFVGSLDVLASIEESSFTNEKVSLRGVSFAERNTLTKTYPANGSDFVKQKAKGVITVSNAFSSQDQALVKTTRFETPDGKIFRMDENVTIPGAKVTEGGIVPSTIDVSVTADQSGTEYNIGPVGRFTIPGFEGSPKFDSFYGESKSSMTGGSSGETKVPTDDDINSAREDIKSVLESASKAQLLLNLPPDLKVLDGSYNFTLIDEDISPTADSNGMFTITARGESKLVGFKEEELLGIFKNRVEKETNVDMSIREFSVEYGEPKIQEEGDGFTVALNFSSSWIRPFDVDQFRNSVVGLDEKEIKSFIFTVPGVVGAEVLLWPFWVGTVPDKIDRINVDVK